MAGLLGEPEHHLGVDEVLGTPERNHPDLHSLQLSPARNTEAPRHRDLFVQIKPRCLRVSVFRLSVRPSPTGTNGTAFSDTESSRARVRACRSTTRSARCPSRNRRAA